MTRLPTLMQVLDAALACDEDDPTSHLTDDLEALIRRLSRARPNDERLSNLAHLLAARVASLSDD